MLSVLKVIGIVIGALILLAIILFLILMFVPFRYTIGGSNKEKLYGYFLVSFFLNIFRVKVYYRDKAGWLSIKIFGIKFLDKTIPEVIELVQKIIDKFSKKEETTDVTTTAEGSEGNTTESTEGTGEEETILETDEQEFEITYDEVEEYLNSPDEMDDMNAVEKNIAFIQAIKDFVLNIKKKWYNFKEFVNEKLDQWEKTKKWIKFIWKIINHPSFAPTLKLFKNITVKFIKHISPRKWRMHIVYGDEDPYVTGQVSRYICMARGYFNREIDFTPVWDGKALEIDGYVKGYMQMYVFLHYAFLLFTNKHLRKMVFLIRRGFKKGGKTRGRK